MSGVKSENCENLGKERVLDLFKILAFFEKKSLKCLVVSRNFRTFASKMQN